MSANEIAEYTMYVQLYKQYKLDCIEKGTVPKELLTFLGQLKAETHAETKKVAESEAPKSSQVASKVTNVLKRKAQTASKCVPSVKKRSQNPQTFDLHILLMPHLGWLNKRATPEERDRLAQVYMAQRVVTFYFSHSSQQNKQAILDAYSDIWLRQFEAQRGVKNGKSLIALPNVTSAELKKGTELLAENGRLGKLDVVTGHFLTMMAAFRGEVVCEVTSVKALDGATIKEITAALSGFMQKGHSLKLSTKVDPSIVGGLVVVIGDRYIDMSLSSKIERYSALLKS